MALSFDTAADAAELHEKSYRALGAAGRLKIALELSDLTHAFATAGICRRHPEMSEEDARRKLAELLYARP
ncbi:MAG: hypothetical protein ACJ74H_02605 [Thermoanaerobaculia bacterium]